MFSRFQEANLGLFLKEIGQDKARELVELSQDYMDALVSGDQDGILDNYDTILSKIEEATIETGIRIMISYSENESYFVAVTAFCARITKALMDAAEFKIEETRPKFGQKVFSTVTEADRWLSENSLIEVTEMKVPTRTAFGILGSHSVAESITLEYIEHNQPTGYQYGMVEFEKAKYITKADPSQYIREWKNRNNVEVVLWRSSSVVTRQHGIHYFDAGLDRAEHVKLFVVYRNNVEVLQK